MSKWYKDFINNPLDLRWVEDILPNWIPGLGYNAPSNQAYRDRDKMEEYELEQAYANLIPGLSNIYRSRDQRKFWEDYLKNRDGVNPNDIKYPWLKLGDTYSASGFGVAMSTVNFISDNVKRLYR